MKEEVEKLREAFNQEFERFNNLQEQNLTLPEAEIKFKEVQELSVKYRGKKSELLSLKKLIGQKNLCL